MSVLQPVVAKWGTLIIQNPEKQIAIGFLIVGLTLPVFILVDSKIVILLVIALFGLGASMVIPNLLAIISLKEDSSSGWAIGMQSSFGGAGQILGPITGTALYIINPSSPFYLTGGLIIATALLGLNDLSENGFKVKNHFIRKSTKPIKNNVTINPSGNGK
jgi:DHA1 family multidrug resistance protein-like MFS transporter